MNPVIDLRSDTVTKPTKGMLDAMMSAEVGDDVYKEDPSANALESRVAQIFGAEEALFFPTGSMANQAAIKLHTQPGEQLICHEWAHVYNYEGGGVSFNSGVSCKLLPGNGGLITSEAVKAAINPPDFYHSPLTSLVCVENTTNKGGGACYSFEELKRIKEVCLEHGLKYHLDGARLWNALEATGDNPKEYGKLFDTISLCFSKGMGTPLGTVLIGTKEAMKNAMRIRKVLGGGMRQIGYMAAAGIYALDHHRERLEQDHKRAKELALCLEKCSYVKEVAPTETNIVIFYLNNGISESGLMNALEQKGIRISSMGEGKLRIVTHLDYTEAMHFQVLDVLPQIKL